jgi:hypothetical protein
VLLSREAAKNAALSVETAKRSGFRMNELFHRYKQRGGLLRGRWKCRLMRRGVRREGKQVVVVEMFDTAKGAATQRTASVRGKRCSRIRPLHPSIFHCNCLL